MNAVETSLDLPGLGADGAVSDQCPEVSVRLELREADGTPHVGSLYVAGRGTDAEVAEALITCVRGVAALRGPGLVAAVQARIR